jgi:hypothetical protein
MHLDHEFLVSNILSTRNLEQTLPSALHHIPSFSLVQEKVTSYHIPSFSLVQEKVTSCCDNLVLTYRITRHFPSAVCMA